MALVGYWGFSLNHHMVLKASFVFWCGYCSLKLIFRNESCNITIWYESVVSTWPSYTSLWHIPKDSTSYSPDTCSAIYITVLFILARRWKQPKCPSCKGWIMTMWYKYTVDYYSTVKKNEVVNFAQTCSKSELWACFLFPWVSMVSCARYTILRVLDSNRV